jgi:hypothetical protein
MLSSKLALPSLVPVGIFSRQVFSECPPNLFQSPFQDITSYNFHVFSISTQNQPPSQKVDCYFFPANKKIILSFLSIKSAKKNTVCLSTEVMVCVDQLLMQLNGVKYILMNTCQRRNILPTEISATH